MQVLTIGLDGIPSTAKVELDEAGAPPAELRISQSIYMLESDARASWWRSPLYHQIDENVLARDLASACQWNPIDGTEASEFDPYHGDAVWMLTQGERSIRVCPGCRGLARFARWGAAPLGPSGARPGPVRKKS